MPRCLSLSLCLFLPLGCADKPTRDTAGLGAIDTGEEGEAPPIDHDVDGDGYLAEVDCDDTNAAIRPDADEVCNGVDDNCDGLLDDEDPALQQAGALTRHADTDGDGHGDAAAVAWFCTVPPGFVEDDADCNDNDAQIYPGAAEVCNGVDDDCDGLIDDDDTGVDRDTAQTFYADADGDGHGDPGVTDAKCQRPTGYVENDADCDDDDAQVHPGAAEVCNGVDDDCDGLLDDADEGLERGTTTAWHLDSDGDGFGASAVAAEACAAPSGTVADATDCDDTNPLSHPGADELCDDQDNDCDAATAEAGAVTRNGSEAHPDLASAIAAARRGDEIVLCEGTHTGEVTAAEVLTIRSLHGAASTVIQGSGGGAVITAGAALTLEGLTLTGGDSLDGGGVDAYTASAGDLTLRDCIVEGNSATYGGGISGPLGHDLLLYDTVVRDNVALLLGGGVYAVDAALEGVRLEGNTALNGGGLYAEGGRITLDADTLLTDNAAVGSTSGVGAGGGLLAYGAIVVLDADTLIEANTAEYGGGMYLLGGSTATGGTIADNRASAEGGGVFLGDDSPSLLDATVSGNTALRGGGVAADANAFKVDGALITDNSADDYGGGLFAYAATRATLLDTTFSNNLADYGAGMLTYQATASLDTVTFRDNLAAAAGGGLYGYDSTLTLTACDLEDNAAASEGGGAALEASSLLSSVSGWGAGTTDNDPDDVYIWDIDTAYDSFGSAASFICTADTRGCR